MKIVTVLGARPQFVKAATVSRVIRRFNFGSSAKRIEECIVHTGQHYDDSMSKVFFDELDIPWPNYNLEIAGGPHGQMTGRMLEGIEQRLIAERPDWVLVYGDTNSTLAGALAATKLHIPVAHVEAGLRSYNRKMPEEINRMLTDKASTLLFCPTETAVRNLRKEAITSGAYNVGDVMYDAALFFSGIAEKRSSILSDLGLQEKAYALSTFHRAENTDITGRLIEILSALSHIAEDYPVIVPLHPRTKTAIEREGLSWQLGRLRIIEPVPYLDMIALERCARVIMTDSGGIQKEAYFYRVPCITFRDETEWIETVQLGWNRIVGANKEHILNAWNNVEELIGTTGHQPYGNGKAAHMIVEKICELK